MFKDSLIHITNYKIIIGDKSLGSKPFSNLITKIYDEYFCSKKCLVGIFCNSYYTRIICFVY